MIKVSIVEDIAIMRDTLIKTIKADPDLLFVSAHATVEDAQAMLPVVLPDIVLLDINMNGKSGIDVIRTVKETNPSMQFMMCTIYENDDNIFESLQAGASGYVLKKASGQIIRNSIKELYEGGSPMSPEIARRVISYFKRSTKVSFLTSREEQILDIIIERVSYKDAAARLDISVATIRNHLHSIYKKLHVKTKSEAVESYLKLIGD